ncbi:hypothetical protein [Lacisediminimonas sp.]|uniref:hypothetical protein n=1 Tax=Lacisediminimonas sp. TaxID=3060582 RepID=UPI0027205546|nr:hypothetical protein [Lacisediminimonas sp.]MDO8298357.1 hypothetical protein [Lacisediminimonas sp.]MDO9219334.1 hypothetical protein [Lacisediminimonas sp.]
MTLSPARVTEDGISFQVRTEYRYNNPSSLGIRDCFISNEVLEMLAQGRSVAAKPEEIFKLMQGKILGVARRMAQAGVPGTPLRLLSATFQ